MSPGPVGSPLDVWGGGRCSMYRSVRIFYLHYFPRVSTPSVPTCRAARFADRWNTLRRPMEHASPTDGTRLVGKFLARESRISERTSSRWKIFDFSVVLYFSRLRSPRLLFSPFFASETGIFRPFQPMSFVHRLCLSVRNPYNAFFSANISMLI